MPRTMELNSKTSPLLTSGRLKLQPKKRKVSLKKERNSKPLKTRKTGMIKLPRVMLQKPVSSNSYNPFS
jgi:hypothetical protein